MRRSSEQIAADLDAKSAKLKADADRRRSVASDEGCSWQYEAEKVVRTLANYFGQFKEGPYLDFANTLKADREARWEALKAKERQS